MSSRLQLNRYRLLMQMKQEAVTVSPLPVGTIDQPEQTPVEFDNLKQKR